MNRFDKIFKYDVNKKSKEREVAGYVYQINNLIRANNMYKDFLKRLYNENPTPSKTPKLVTSL